MNNCYDPATYGEACAEFYDQIYGYVSPKMVATLARVAAGGPVLEFGIATGRVAVQLARLGLAVTGIEASSAMLRKILEREVPTSITPVQGDFTDATLSEVFSLVFCIHSTVLLLPPEQQRQCFKNAIKHLRPAGIFLVEASVRWAEGVPNRNHLRTALGGVTRCYRLQTVGGVRDYEVTQYYTPPKMLDRMATEAGLMLLDRWSDWMGTPFSEQSPVHISLYTRRLARPMLASAIQW